MWFKRLKLLGLVFLLIISTGNFSSAKNEWTEAQMMEWVNRCFNESYNPAAVPKLKKWELSLNEQHFIRLRITYKNNTQAYYSFQLKRLADLVYIGKTTDGELNLITRGDDIINQTYNSRKGNIDEMSSSLAIPVKNMEPERIDSLRTALFKLRDGE